MLHTGKMLILGEMECNTAKIHQTHSLYGKFGNNNLMRSWWKQSWENFGYKSTKRSLNKSVKYLEVERTISYNEFQDGVREKAIRSYRQPPDWDNNGFAYNRFPATCTADWGESSAHCRAKTDKSRNWADISIISKNELSCSELVRKSKKPESMAFKQKFADGRNFNKNQNQRHIGRDLSENSRLSEKRKVKIIQVEIGGQMRYQFLIKRGWAKNLL